MFSLTIDSEQDYCFSYASASIRDLFGVEPEDVLVDSSLVTSRINALDWSNMLDLMKQSQEIAEPLSCTFRVYHHTRGMLWVECIASSRRNSATSISWHGVMTDVTRRKIMEARLLQSEKMEAIGRLAGGVAHDFNNLLTVVIGSCHLLEQEMKHSRLDTSHVQTIRDSSLRASSLTKQLLAFSRQQVVAPQYVNINELIKRSELIFRRLIGDHATLKLELQQTKKTVFIDPSQLEQVLINLLVNSRDAMLEAGFIKVACKEVQRVHATQDNGENALTDFIEISIADTGCGMTAEVQAKMFDPFYTTKPVGEGTGLGLAVVHGTVIQSGGFIEVQSQVGQGTIIHIYLPACMQNACVEPSADPLENINGGRETILVVDDDVALGEITAKNLSALGYEVHVANSADQAIRVFQKLGSQVDLLLTDLSMPQISGDKLAEMLRKISQSLKVVFMTGNSLAKPASAAAQYGETTHLAKPFSPVDLAHHIRQVFDRSGMSTEARRSKKQIREVSY